MLSCRAAGRKERLLCRNSTAELRVRDGSLYFVHKNAGSKDPLRCEGDDLFGFGGIRIKFRRENRGKILGFAIDSAQAKGLLFRNVIAKQECPL